MASKKKQIKLVQQTSRDALETWTRRVDFGEREEGVSRTPGRNLRQLKRGEK